MAGPRSYITEFTHLLDAEGKLACGPSAVFARCLSLVVEQGSVMAVGDGGLVAMPCVAPAASEPCAGRLVVARPMAETIEWQCPDCGVSGVISNWRGTSFDLEAAILPPQTEETASAVVELDELWAMRRLGGGAAALRRLLVEAMDFGEGYFAFEADHATLVELRDLAGSAADRVSGEDRRLLDRFAARMDAFRTGLGDFIEPGNPPVDLVGAADADTLPEVIALAREIAWGHGREEVGLDDLLEAEVEVERRSRTPLH